MTQSRTIVLSLLIAGALCFAVIFVVVLAARLVRAEPTPGHVQATRLVEAGPGRKMGL